MHPEIHFKPTNLNANYWCPNCKCINPELMYTELHENSIKCVRCQKIMDMAFFLKEAMKPPGNTLEEICKDLCSTT